MRTLKNEVDLLELLGEREARLLERSKRKEVQLLLDKFELKSVQMEKSCTLTKIAFYSGISMDKVKDMVVTKSGVFMKGAYDVGPVPINCRDSSGTAREQVRKTGTGE